MRHPSPTPAPFHDVRIRSIRSECGDVKSFELARVDGAPLQGQSPGAHIDVRLPQGQVRSYSLIGSSIDDGACRIAVKRERDGRGASTWLHQVAQVGTALQVADPVNHFPLVEDAPRSVLFAGGIGITPILSMVRRLSQLRRAWELHYAATSAASMPFQEEIAQLARETGARVQTYRADAGRRRMALDALVAETPADAHLYCCGPARMIDAFVEAGRSRPAGTLHFERFAAAQQAVKEGGFSLHLARDGRTLLVPPGQTILDTLVKAGINVPSSCGQGVCGTCQVGVLEGLPDHRDDYLTKTERDSNEVMLVCCSGARSPSLTLDL